MTNDYQPPWLWQNGHLNTMAANLLRPRLRWSYTRSTVELPDGDFLDVDGRYSSKPTSTALVILHGMEGSSESVYARGMATLALRMGWDGLVLNFRSCSGRMNRLLRLYHSGDTADLQFLLSNPLLEKYETLLLMGFSLGGNVLLKFLGERGTDLDERIRAAMAFSVPCDLLEASDHIDRWPNAMYRLKFMWELWQKLRVKARQFPEQLDLRKGPALTFADFDDWYTAPLHGFASGRAYKAYAASLQYLPGIRVPTLLVNAQDDSFLSPNCYPHAIAAEHPYFQFLAPRYGGHVGFAQDIGLRTFWSEQLAADFLQPYGVSNA